MSDGDTSDLKQSLLSRAQRIADEYRQHGRQRREEILSESAARRKLREEREVLAAKAAAERTYRQEIQAAELRGHGEIEHLRWTLVQSVLSQLDERTARAAADEKTYLPLLARLIEAGARMLPDAAIVVQLNARDLSRLKDRWTEFALPLAPGKQLVLDPEPFQCSGGALLRDSANRKRVDQTFEGRRRRLENELAETVMEQLFTDQPFHG
jgi:V/A-type H+-transporting ATPase subunit E